MAAKILIVDDDAAIRDMIMRILSMDEYELTTAANGLEALQRVAMEKPDLMLLDVSMAPGPDGYEVCRQIKSDPETTSVPITFLTFQSELEDRKMGIAAGADDYLTKPVQQDLLRAHVRAQLQVRQQTDQLEPSESVVFSLARSIEARDNYTTGHLRRMEHFSEQLAVAAGLPSGDITFIRYGAILHDVGKIRVREAILNKPGALTPDEFAQLKQHCEHGAQMISHMSFARKVAPIVLSHHEKWDGSGYPQGLRGERIPIGARIVSIVSAYDAMSTDRPYRRALSQQETIRRLQAGKGAQWDPTLIDIFCSLIEEEKLTEPDQDPKLLAAEVNQTSNKAEARLVEAEPVAPEPAARPNETSILKSLRIKPFRPLPTS